MAVTYITRIYATIDKSIDYIIRDKVVLTGKDMEMKLQEEAMEKANNYLDNAIDYIERDKELISVDGKLEIRKTLTSSLNCYYDSAKDEFEVVRNIYNQSDGKVGVGKNDREILGYHVWQSFEETIDGKLANEIGVKLADEMYGDYQCVISTHTNTEHTHNHIVFNAVSINGNKYNICTANTRKLREVSDRLCEEYGLNVLQHTKGMKLKWYKDEAGNWNCFEPTERKRQIAKGEYSNKNDYRNYEAYINSEQYKESNRSIIRKDIDRYIPQSKDLDDLIEKLENIGYEVKNLNSKGEYLKSISFKAPSQDGFIRGKANSLGKDYTRESIIKRIEEAKRSRNEPHLDVGSVPAEKAPHPHQHIEYDYENINIDEIDEEKRKRYNKVNATWEWVRRSELEKYVIKDVKFLNNRVDELYKNAQYQNLQEKQYYGRKAEQQKTIDRINDSLQALKFIENKNIKSFQQINDTVQSLHEKNEQIDIELVKIKEYLKEMNMDIVLIKQYNDLKHSIAVNSSNSDYVTFELKGEEALLEKYEQILKAKKLITAEKQAEYVSKFENYNARYTELAMAKERINKMINEYDMTVKVLDRVDRDYDRKYREDVKEYYNISNEKQQASKGRNER